ncbi:MAG: hypothetical protein WDW36_005497 [Sanguina aurantia]
MASELLHKAKAYGPAGAGALFGAGWWFWADAITTSPSTVPFLEYLPGIIATLALIMINCIRRDDLAAVDPFDDPSYCRSRFWLFLSYIVSFSAVVAAVWIMLLHYSQHPEQSAAEKWPGVAGIFQVCLILASGLLFFLARTPADGDGYDGYGSF